MKTFEPNWFAFCLSMLSIFLISMGMFTTDWLKNSETLTAYPFMRSWGLFEVTGQVSRTHARTMEIACAAAVEYGFLGTGTSTVCFAFKDKCQAWKILMYLSYATAAGLTLAAILVLLCSIVQMKNNTRTKRIATYMAIAGTFVLTASCIVYVVVANVVFTIVNSNQVYPVPNVGFSYVVTWIAAVVNLVLWKVLFSEVKARARRSEYITTVRGEVHAARSNLGIR